jgi:hypothetical protein
MSSDMITLESEIALDPGALPLAEPPPVPALPAVGPRRSETLQAHARRIVEKLGAPAALLLAAELDEAVAEVEHGKFGSVA